MSYQRKTKDEWQVWAKIPNYSKSGFEWEELCASDNRKEARDDLKSYRLNDKNALEYKLKKVRVKNEK